MSFEVRFLGKKQERDSQLKNKKKSFETSEMRAFFVCMAFVPFLWGKAAVTFDMRD